MTKSVPAAEAKVRGYAFLGFIDAVRHRFGTDGVARLKRERTGIDIEKIDSDAWYTLNTYLEFLGAIKHEFSADSADETLIFELGKLAADFDTPRFYRILARIMTPAYLFGRAPALWRSTFNFGEIEIVDQSSNRAVVYVHGVPPGSRLLWQDLQGSNTRLVELTGARNANIKILEGGGDETFIRVEITWF